MEQHCQQSESVNKKFISSQDILQVAKVSVNNFKHRAT